MTRSFLPLEMKPWSLDLAERLDGTDLSGKECAFDSKEVYPTSKKEPRYGLAASFLFCFTFLLLMVKETNESHSKHSYH